MHTLFQEGPHSALNEEEFFDALEMAYQQDEMGKTPAPREQKPVEDKVSWELIH